MLGTINLRFIVIIVTLSLSFLSGWWINGWRWEAKAYVLEQKYTKQALAIQKLTEDYLIIQKTKDARQNIITKQVYLETTKPEYSCIIPPAGLLILNKAVTTANASKLDR